MTEENRQNKNSTIYNIILQLKKRDAAKYTPLYIYEELAKNLQSVDHEILKEIDLLLLHNK